jgi:hypothetical protein
MEPCNTLGGRLVRTLESFILAVKIHPEQIVFRHHKGLPAKYLKRQDSQRHAFIPFHALTTKAVRVGVLRATNSL